MPAKNNQPARSAMNPPAQRDTVYYAPAPTRSGRRPLLWLLFPVLFLLVVAIGVTAGGLTFAYARGRVMPGVTAYGVPVSGLTRAEVAAAVQARWDEQSITLQNGDLTWP